MTPKELLAWQRRCGYRTQTEAAQKLGLSPVSYSRKLHKKTRISPMMERLCGCLEKTAIIERSLDPRTVAAAETAVRVMRLVIEERLPKRRALSTR